MKSKGARKRKDSGRGSGPMSARALLERIERKEGAEEDGSRLTARERAYVERARAAQEMQERAFDRPTMTQAQMMLASLRGAGPLVVKRFREGGDVDLAEQMTVGTLPMDREPGKAEELFRAMVEGGQGFLGLEPGRRGSEAYRTGQALSNLPALALPAAAIKGTGKAKDVLKAIKKSEGEKLVTLLKEFREEGNRAALRRLERIGDEAPYAAERIDLDALRSALSRGDNADLLAIISPKDFKYLAAQLNSDYWTAPDVGKIQAPAGMSVQEYVTYLGQAAKEKGFKDIPFLEYGEHLGTTRLGVKGHEGRHRMKALEELEDEKALVRLFPRASVREPLPRKSREDFLQALREKYGYGPSGRELKLDPEGFESTLSDLSKRVEPFKEGGEVSTTDFIRKREKGSPPEGEVPTDDYIQQMMTGTPPADRTTNPGLLPPELRQAIDVPLDLANTFIRSAAGAVAGPVYGLYKGVTSDKFGTPEGVQEASSEAGRMMQKITGTPKTQAARDVLETIGGVAQEAKIPPMPQFLTTPAPGPGSARALMKSYEFAETPPEGAVKPRGGLFVGPEKEGSEIGKYFKRTKDGLEKLVDNDQLDPDKAKTIQSFIEKQGKKYLTTVYI